MRDIFSNIGARVAFKPATVTAAGTGETIDLLEARKLAFIVATGAVAGSGDFGVKIQESDTGTSGWTDAPAEHQQTNAPATLGADGAYRLGYLGWKRYVRLAVTKAGGTSIILGAVAVTSENTRPVA